MSSAPHPSRPVLFAHNKIPSLFWQNLNMASPVTEKTHVRGGAKPGATIQAELNKKRKVVDTR